MRRQRPLILLEGGRGDRRGGAERLGRMGGACAFGGGAGSGRGREAGRLILPSDREAALPANKCGLNGVSATQCDDKKSLTN